MGGNVSGDWWGKLWNIFCLHWGICLETLLHTYKHYVLHSFIRILWKWSMAHFVKHPTSIYFLISYAVKSDMPTCAFSPVVLQQKWFLGLGVKQLLSGDILWPHSRCSINNSASSALILKRCIYKLVVYLSVHNFMAIVKGLKEN